MSALLPRSPYGWFSIHILAALAAAVLALPAAAPAWAKAAERKNGIDYTKPYIDDRANSQNPLFRLCPPPFPELKTKQDYEAAVECLRELLSKPRTPDERAMLLRFKAQLEVELGNFRQAIRDIEASFETGALTKTEKAENYYFLGRLYLGVEPPDYGKAIENLRKFIGMTDDPPPDAFFYLGQALALQNKFKEAIPYAEKAIELTKKPKEGYQRLLLFCFKELGNHERLIVLLAEHMIERFGAKDEYLTALAEALRALGREKDAFLTDVQRYELGFMTEEAEIIRLAGLYVEHGNPHRAARILEKEMKAGRVKRSRENLEKLGNMWFLAREYKEAREILSEVARLKTSGTDECNPRNGCHRYFDDSPEAWRTREQQLRRALKDGKLKEPCHAHILLAHALYSQDKAAEAIAQFERAAKSETCAEEARQWIEYLEVEEEVRHRVTPLFQFMSDLIYQLQLSVAILPDDENIRAIAAEALESARAALTAESAEVRRRKLAEYERARKSVLRHLDAGALEEARRGRTEAEKILAKAKEYDLTREEKELLQRLDKSSKRRIEALEQAQADLKKAAKVAEQVREEGGDNPD